jgi:hypothetical protein
VRQELVRALVADIRMDTVEVGVSRRGNVKRGSEVHVTYTFTEPSHRIQDVDLSARAPAYRIPHV